MKKVFKFIDMLDMDKNQLEMISSCLRLGALSLIGIVWKKYYRIETDLETKDVIIYYE